MPEHYAIDANVLSGTIHLQNAKLAVASFLDKDGNEVSFTKAPRVTLTLLNQTTATPYKVQDVKVGNVYVGFKIGFQSVVTMDVEWQALKRES